ERLSSLVRRQLSQLKQQDRRIYQTNLDFLRGHLHAARGRYLEAIPLLERVLVSFESPDPGSPEAARRVQVLVKLGECYQALEQWDQAATAYQEAAALQPNSTQLTLAAAKVWARTNRFDLAREKYEQAGQRELPTEEWVYWAFTRLRQQLEKPADE